MRNKCFSNKEDEYYNLDKTGMLPFIQEGENVILDLGCAAGRLGMKLREQNKAGELVGVEIFQPAADEAGKYYDKVYVADIETLQLPYRKYFDYVVCGDILEHLRDPMVTLERIHEWLKDGGNLLVTVPNIRYWRILRDLVFLGKWEYVDAGILDNTHMRFFTRRSILNILQRSSFSIIHYEMMIVGVKHKLANKTTLGLLKEVFAPQIMIVAKKR